MVKKAKRDFLGVLVWGAVFLIVVIGVAVKFGIEKAQADEILAKFPDRGIPRMNITLNDISLEEINEGSKDEKYEGNEVVVYEGGEMSEYEGVEIKGRGNTTWLHDKKPYQIKFKKKTDLLGMGKAKKWVLLANSLDATHLRNDIAMRLAEMVGMKYNHRGKFVEFYVDDNYVGLYYVLQKVEVSKGSVDLKRNDGLLFELDMVHRSEPVFYMTRFGECLVLKDSVINDSEKLKGIVDVFMLDINEAEKAIEERDYKRVIKIFDIDSFAQYFLINEFAVNPDAYSTSFYIYRNNEGKIAAGPVWDFDLAFANREWVWQVDERLFSPYEEMVKKREAFGSDGLEEDLNISKLLYFLMDMPEFKEKVVSLYQDRLLGRREELIKGIQSNKNVIEDAIKTNGEKWASKRSFEEEYNRLIEWIKARYDFLEGNYGKKVKWLQ